MTANKLIVTEEGFAYSVHGTEISIVCAKNKAREGVIYVFQFQDKDGKGIGQSFTSRKLPNEEDKKRDNKIIEIIGTKIGLDREEAEKIISDLIESFNALPLEEKEKLKTIQTKEVEPKKLLNAVELFDLVGEAFEGVSVFNEPVFCYNRGIVYEHKIPRQNSKSGAQSYRTEYNLYAMKLSKYVTSNVNYPFAVVTPGHVVLSEGEIEIYKRPSIELLKNKSPLNSPVCHEGAFRSVLINEFRMEGEEGEGRDKIPLTTAEIWDNFLKSGRIFELTTPVPLEELKNVKNIDAVLELAITDGLKKDTTLVTLMLAQIPKPDTSELEPDQYMPYAPNSIAITKTKTGKTTTAQRLSKNVVNRPTVANLLGFSTAEDTHVGELDCQMDTCFVDEITENADENVSGGLLSYLETGITKTARGHGITVRGHAPMVFMGNPKIEGTTDYDLLEYLRNIINQMTNNPQALGSRLGFLIFDNNMDRVTGLGFDREISKKSLMVLRTLQEAYRGQFSALFKDREVLKWLNTPFEDWYLNSLTEAENKSSLNQVKEFIRGLKDAYKHVRGTALHITFVESYEVLLTNGNLNIQEFLVGCDYWYQYLLAHTVETLNKIVSVRLDNSIYRKILDSSPDYIKLFVRTCFLYDLDSSMLPLDTFEDKYPQVATDAGKYVNFGNLKNNMLKNKTKTNELLKRYGLRFTDFNGIALVGVGDAELYRIFMTAYRETEGSQGSGGSNVGKSEPSEPHEPSVLSKGIEPSEQKEEQMAQIDKINLILKAIPTDNTTTIEKIQVETGLSGEYITAAITHLKNDGDIIEIREDVYRRIQ